MKRRSIRSAGVAIMAFSLGCGSLSFPASSAGANPPVRGVDHSAFTVFVVHGTYDGTSDWVKDIDGKVTFAGQFKKSLGSQQTIVEPFLWRTSIHHNARMQAAGDLAQLIDDPRNAERRIVLLGHSHGGNVCLAAAGKCHRPIETVVCLATPHFHVVTRGTDNQIHQLPVYCSPQSRKNIGRILTVSASADPVVNTWADLRRGIDEQTAIRETYDWRRLLDFPRLLDDGGPIREVVEDVLKQKLSTSMVVSTHLTVTDHEVDLASENTSESAHYMIHSSRMGQILGSVLNDQFSRKSLDHLLATVIPENADQGGPLALSDHRELELRQAGAKVHSGWILASMEVESKSLRRSDGRKWDIDGSHPDLLARFLDGGRLLGTTPRTVDKRRATWKPMVHFQNGRQLKIEVLDGDLAFHDFMGSLLIAASHDDPPQATYDGEQFTIQMYWVKGHY